MELGLQLSKLKVELGNEMTRHNPSSHRLLDKVSIANLREFV